MCTHNICAARHLHLRSRIEQGSRKHNIVVESRWKIIKWFQLHGSWLYAYRGLSSTIEVRIMGACTMGYVLRLTSGIKSIYHGMVIKINKLWGRNWIIGEKLLIIYRNVYTWIITRIGITMSGVFTVTWSLEVTLSLEVTWLLEVPKRLRRSSNKTSLSTNWHLYSAG